MFNHLPTAWSVYVDASKEDLKSKEFKFNGEESFGCFSISSNIWKIGDKTFNYAIGLSLKDDEAKDWRIFSLEQFAHSEVNGLAVPKKVNCFTGWPIARKFLPLAKCLCLAPHG